MYNSQEIAKKIKEVASQKSISLGTMFAELDISNNTLHNMKTSMPKADTIAKIADYLGVSADYLLGTEKIAPIEINRDDLNDKLLQLTESEIDELINYADYLKSKR